MAQIKIPVEFALQLTLLQNIIDKNNDLEAESPLIAWLAEQQIDLTADQTAGVNAETQENIRAQQDATSKMAYTSRDNNFTPVFQFIRAAAQVLKKFYLSNYATLRDWSLPITDSGRIDYPASFEERNAVAVKFFKKQASFGAGKSPLEAYIKANNIDVTTLSKKNDDAAKNNTDAIAAAKAAENATEQRNLLWENPLKHIHLIGDFLKSIYPSNPRALGEWGFVVDENTSTFKARRVKFMIGETRSIENVALGSIVINLGKGEAIIHKGKGTAGITTVLRINEKMGILKGYTTITVVNLSTLETLELSITPPEK